jgi:hypothetical protein
VFEEKPQSHIKRAAWRGQWPQPNSKHEILNPKQISITKTQISKQTAIYYHHSVYENLLLKTSIKNKKLKDSGTKELTRGGGGDSFVSGRNLWPCCI